MKGAAPVVCAFAFVRLYVCVAQAVGQKERAVCVATALVLYRRKKRSECGEVMTFVKTAAQHRAHGRAAHSVRLSASVRPRAQVVTVWHTCFFGLVCAPADFVIDAGPDPRPRCRFHVLLLSVCEAASSAMHRTADEAAADTEEAARRGKHIPPGDHPHPA